ncbi:hypothetical protein JHK87_015486 [Glycine soja]|nr:hypothetical protein JHK87_015486 [Glycine soja]
MESEFSFKFNKKSRAVPSSTWTSIISQRSMEPGCLPALHQFRNLQIWSNVYLPPPSTIAELHRHPVNTNSASNSIDVVENKGANPPIFESRRNLRPPSTIYMHFHYNKQIEELPERPGEPECSYFLKTGHCKFKSDCKFHHPKSWIERLPPCNLNDKSLPLRPERKVCRYYGRYRICKFGRVCMFHHPQLCKTSSKARELKLCW